MSNLETPRTKKRRIRESAGLGNLSNSENNSNSNSNSGIVTRYSQHLNQQNIERLLREQFKLQRKTQKNKRNKNRQTRKNLGLSNNSESNSNNNNNNETKFKNWARRRQPVKIPSHLRRKGPVVIPKFKVKASNPLQKASNSQEKALTEPLKASNSPPKSTNKTTINKTTTRKRTRNNRNKKTKKYVNYKFTNNEGAYKQRLKKSNGKSRNKKSKKIRISEPIRNNLGNDPVVLMFKSEKKNNINELNQELRIQRELANSGLAPIVNNNYANVNKSNIKSINYRGKKIYYVQKMTTFDQIGNEMNHFLALRSLLESTEKLYLNHGYIPLDMKEENLVIDNSEKIFKVIFIDTDPKFFVKINIKKKYVNGVKLFVLLMILFINSNMGAQRKNKRILNLYGNHADSFFIKKSFLRTFILSITKGDNEARYKQMKDMLHKINEEIIKYNGKDSYDIQYMFFHYLLGSYRGVIPHPGLRTNYYENIDYIGIILQHYVKPILDKLDKPSMTNGITINNLLNQPLKILKK